MKRIRGVLFLKRSEVAGAMSGRRGGFVENVLA